MNLRRGFHRILVFIIVILLLFQSSFLLYDVANTYKVGMRELNSINGSEHLGNANATKIFDLSKFKLKKAYEGGNSDIEIVEYLSKNSKDFDFQHYKCFAIKLKKTMLIEGIFKALGLCLLWSFICYFAVCFLYIALRFSFHWILKGFKRNPPPI